MTQAKELIDFARGRARLLDRGTTHWAGCWRDHPRCLACALADELEAAIAAGLPSVSEAPTVDSDSRGERVERQSDHD